MQGQINVNNENLSQGNTPEIERKVLFIGIGATGVNSLIALNSQSDLDQLLGVPTSEIKTILLAAQVNGGANWQGYAVPIAAAGDWTDALTLAFTSVSIEAVVICTPVTSSNDLDQFQTEATSLLAATGRRVAFFVATPGIDTENETWAQYLIAQTAIVADVAARRVIAVPNLHGNDIGVLSGRLCNHSVSIADSPMRVRSQSNVGLGPKPTDSNGLELSGATLTALESQRFTCTQSYPDYQGTYWGDCNTLDVVGSDFAVYENLRLADKAARKVRDILISMVADRSVNSSPGSIASTKNRLTAPLRVMSHGSEFNGIPFPGEIEPPQDGDIAVVWKTKTEVQAYLSITPLDSPKKLSASILVNLAL